MLFALALTFASIAFAQHWHHGRPHLNQHAHRALMSNATEDSFPTPNTSCDYWLENINHQGLSPFHGNPSSYQVFRNVKDYGAVGDGVSDDTLAINSAISSGDRCSPFNCESSTTTPAVVYFPAGTYLVSSSIIVFYETQLIGNPNCLPILKPSLDFKSPPGRIGIIDGDSYDPSGLLGFSSTNTFYRQVRNFIIDMTSFPASRSIRGIHWPTGQATSLQNIVFQMSDAPGTQHEGIFMEEGSGGFMADLVFEGGLNGANWGNQQFTMRNLTFSNAVTAINQIWDWGWTYKSVAINNCSTGLNMSSADPATGQLTVGSVTLIDSSIENTPIGVATARNVNSLPPTAGSLIIENVDFNNVASPVSGVSTPSINEISSRFGAGRAYTPDGHTIDGALEHLIRPTSLLQSDGRFYERSKPQYSTEPLEMFYSVRSGGARGDGVTDDTAALQRVINLAASLHKIVFFDFGIYRVTRTLYVPPGSRIVGESYPVILSSGRFFANMNRPQPVIRIGIPGDKGSVEWSDMIVSTQGSQAGAILIEINIESPPDSPTGLWDVHTRIGGFTGSHLQQVDCPKTPNVATPPAAVNRRCIAAFMAMHITKPAAGIYLENVWLWTADHDLDDPSGQNTQITIYTGRGLLIESQNGPVWLVGTAVEHFALYQYQFANTKNIFAGQIQTETAYYQPNPPAPIPFPPVPTLNDPIFPSSSSSSSTTNNIPPAEGWALRVVNSDSIRIYGAGLYSFFIDYNNTCAPPTDPLYCQPRILSLENVSDIVIYNLNTVGAASMLDRDGVGIVRAADNLGVFPDGVAVFRGV